MLAQLVQKSPEYKKSYQDAKGYKILDNGVAEGAKVKMADLNSIAWDIGASEIVVPDVMGDTQKTIKLAHEFAEFAQPAAFQYMGVIQGKTMPDIIKCATALSFLEYITVLALPRCLTNIHRAIRVNFASSLKDMYDRQLPIHCLGSGKDPREVVLLAGAGVRSFDSSMPFVLGYRGESIKTAEYTVRQNDYFNLPRPSLSQRQLIEDNIRTLLEWAGDEPAY